MSHYYCDCVILRKKAGHTEHFINVSMYPTEINKDKKCIHCGYYARLGNYYDVHKEKNLNFDPEHDRLRRYRKPKQYKKIFKD
ncbi:MAG: hypothetical protein FMNOHCHN_03774 [Ignavibacteriaceae bacterium]|nr:hypothetical protein [Ignavibacteriaceae bacterium]